MMVNGFIKNPKSLTALETNIFNFMINHDEIQFVMSRIFYLLDFFKPCRIFLPKAI